MHDSPQDMVSVRYIVDDVQDAIDFYTAHLGFALQFSAVPAFAAITRGQLRLLLAGPESSGGQPLPDGRVPKPGGWNRIHLTTQDIDAEVERLRAAGLKFRSEVLIGVGGSQILLEDPSGNPIELYQPAPFQPTRRPGTSDV
jgi:catechol 2,3-dioxygenase-like lactoylglutathione lyase family enzyme